MRGVFAAQQTWLPYVGSGSDSAIGRCRLNVRFTRKAVILWTISGSSANGCRLRRGFQQNRACTETWPPPTDVIQVTATSSRKVLSGFWTEGMPDTRPPFRPFRARSPPPQAGAFICWPRALVRACQRSNSCRWVCVRSSARSTGMINFSNKQSTPTTPIMPPSSFRSCRHRQR